MLKTIKNDENITNVGTIIDENTQKLDQAINSVRDEISEDIETHSQIVKNRLDKKIETFENNTNNQFAYLKIAYVLLFLAGIIISLS